jgi:hypothetical protein
MREAKGLLSAHRKGTIYNIGWHVKGSVVVLDSGLKRRRGLRSSVGGWALDLRAAGNHVGDRGDDEDTVDLLLVCGSGHGWGWL